MIHFLLLFILYDRPTDNNYIEYKTELSPVSVMLSRFPVASVVQSKWDGNVAMVSVTPQSARASDVKMDSTDMQ